MLTAPEQQRHPARHHAQPGPAPGGAGRRRRCASSVLKRDDLAEVSELFLTGTTSEVLPIVTVDGQPVGDGQPGPVTRRLQEAYRQAVREFVGRMSRRLAMHVQPTGATRRKRRRTS